MSYICHSGYGYSKILCEDVTSWFVNNYYPRHKLDIDIVHRGLKCDRVVGLCDVNGPSSRPRAFLTISHFSMAKPQFAINPLCHVGQFMKKSFYIQFLLHMCLKVNQERTGAT